MLHRPENKKECYSHGNKRKSIIYPFHRSEDHANGGCGGGFIAYGVYFNRNVRASATVSTVNEKFILSLTESAAKTLDKIPAEVDFSTQCAAVMQDMSMEGVPSAYGYLVDSDGTMLYHPTADKIGKAVEMRL